MSVFAKLDKLEGLPKLAEGYFWRIRPTMDGPSAEYSVLELRKKRLGFLSKMVSFGAFLANPRDSVMEYSWNRGKTRAEVTAEDLCRAATDLVKQHNNRKEASSLYGDYIS